jgi:hypothetical protein
VGFSFLLVAAIVITCVKYAFGLGSFRIPTDQTMLTARYLSLPANYRLQSLYEEHNRQIYLPNTLDAFSASLSANKLG